MSNLAISLAPAGASENKFSLVSFCRNCELEALGLLISRVILFLYDAIARNNYAAWFYLAPVLPEFPKLLTHAEMLADMCRYMPLDRSVLAYELKERCQHLGELVGVNPNTIARIYYIAQLAGIPDSRALWQLPQYSVIQRVHGELALGREMSAGFLVFCGKYDAPEFLLTQNHFPDGSCTLLPVAFFSDKRAPNGIAQLFEMPEADTLPLLHSETVRARGNCTVEICSDLAVAACSTATGSTIEVGWYGAMETWSRVDLAPLTGHPLLLRCNDQPDAAPATRYRETAALLERLDALTGRISIRMLDGAVWQTKGENGVRSGSASNERILTPAEFAEEAHQHGVECRGLVPQIRLRTYSMDDLLAVPPKDFSLYPVLKEGFYCLIYGGTGVAKTWFALHLGIALSQGTSPFPHWECRTASQNVLYVAGEMDLSIYGERLQMLLADQKTNEKFRFIRENLDLTMPEDQAKIDEITISHQSRVVFLDNLSTLASNGHTEGQFGKFFRFIEQLQKRGIIVVLIHHENREGGFKGSGKIELVTDQSLHLFATGKGDKIELLVKAEKIRMTARSKQGAFRTEFDPKHPCAVWPVFALTEEERRRLDEDDPLDEVGSNIGKKRNNQQRAWRYLDDDERAVAIIDDMLTGCLDDVIAANLAVRKIAISEFKLKNGITEEALKRHLPEIRKIAEKDWGDSKPSVLAPLLWKSLKTESNC